MRMSSCCGVSIIENTDLCSDCKEHCGEVKTFKIDYVDVFEGTCGHTTVEAEDREAAEVIFEDQSDGCAIVIIKEIEC